MLSLKKITFIVSGSRGDIQPYIAIGSALKEAGYYVRILTNADQLSFVQSFGLDCTAAFADVQKMLREDPNAREILGSGDTAEFFKCVGKVWKGHAIDDVRNFLNEMQNNTPDLLVAGSVTPYFGHYALRVLNIPMVTVRLNALTYDPERGPWGIPTLPDGKHWDIMMKLIGMFYEGFYELDKAMVSLGGEELVPIYPKSEFLKHYQDPVFPLLVCQSPLIKDAIHPRAPKNMHFVGASVIESAQQEMHNGNFGGNQAHDQIEAFLSDDPERKPVYCGWGSMLCKSAEQMVLLAVRALQLCDQRGIILGGWAGLSMDLLRRATSDNELITYAEGNILFVEKAAHESLFPKVACTVHHGGAGTTNTALRSGVPTVITPVFIDQHDHAHLVNKLGVGVGFSRQLQKISAEELSSAIRRVIEEETFGNRAREFREKFREEDGAAAVVSRLVGFWKEYVETSKFKEIIDEEHKHVLSSTIAS